jgi:hypothetical protein
LIVGLMINKLQARYLCGKFGSFRRKRHGNARRYIDKAVMAPTHLVVARISDRDGSRAGTPRPLPVELDPRTVRGTMDRCRPFHGVRARPCFACSRNSGTNRCYRLPCAAHPAVLPNGSADHGDCRLVSRQLAGVHESCVFPLRMDHRSTSVGGGHDGARPRLSPSQQSAYLVRIAQGCARPGTHRAHQQNQHLAGGIARCDADRDHRRDGPTCRVKCPDPIAY